MTVKDIVEVKSEDRLLHADGILPWLEGVTQADGCGAIAWQRTSLALGVIEILTADEIGMPYCLEISETECCHTIEYHRGREGKGGVVIVRDHEVFVPIVADILIEVQYAVTAEGSVHIQRKPLEWSVSCTDFQTHTIGVGDVGGKSLAYVAQLPCLYQLVLVVHIVHTSREIPVGGIITIAHLHIVKTFCSWCTALAVVGKVVTLWFARTHGITGIGTMSVLVPGDSCLGVQEIVCLIDIQRLCLIESVGILLELVVISVSAETHMAILHISKSIPLVRKMIGGLGK